MVFDHVQKGVSVADKPAGNVPSPDQIVSALSQTGFIFEHRVAQRLREHGLRASLNHAFMDSDTGKSREVDVIADVSDGIEGDGLLDSFIVQATLVVECKNYSDPLVVIGAGNEVFYHNDEPMISFDPVLHFEYPSFDRYSSVGIRHEMDLGDLSGLVDRGFIGSQLVRMDRNRGEWRAGNDSVHDSIIYPLVKARDYERIELTRDPEDLPWELPEFSYTLSVLVTAGPVFTVDIVKDGDPVVARVSWSPIVRHFSDRSAMIYVVAFDGIADFLEERVFPITRETKNRLSQNLHFFDPRWLAERYGQSSDPDFIKWLSQVSSIE